MPLPASNDVVLFPSVEVVVSLQPHRDKTIKTISKRKFNFFMIGTHLFLYVSEIIVYLGGDFNGNVGVGAERFRIEGSAGVMYNKSV